MTRLRYRLAVRLFDLAARIYPPFWCRTVAQAHHVGNRWLDWKLSNPPAAKPPLGKIRDLSAPEWTEADRG